MTAPENAEPTTSDPHGGLSASGRTADQMHPGTPAPGTTYGDPGGTATAGEEVAGAPANAPANAPAGAPANAPAGASTNASANAPAGAPANAPAGASAGERAGGEDPDDLAANPT